MKEKTFVITYTKLNGESVTRPGKWTAKCLQKIADAGHACLIYLDLDATEAEGKDAYRTATDKITNWKIKLN